MIDPTVWYLLIGVVALALWDWVKEQDDKGP